VVMLMLGTKYAGVHFRIIFEIVIDGIADAYAGIARRVRPDTRKRDRRDRRASILADVVTRLERRAVTARE
jgi:hypothetical protein